MQNDETFINTKRINTIIKKVGNLPTLPSIFYKVMDMVNKGDTSVSEITTVISQDQSLTTTTLRIVNSAFYGFPRKITTVNHALVILGFNEIKNILLSASVFDAFSENTDSKSSFSRAEFWRHCIGCGTAGKMLAKTFNYRASGEVFVAGLLHDIGKLIMDQYMHNEFIKAVELAMSECIPIIDAEKSILKVTHTQIGKLLLEHWRMPPHLVDAVAFHHKPYKSEKYSEIASIIHFADILCRINDIGSGGDPTVPDVDPYAWNLLKEKKLDLHRTDIDKFAFDLEIEIEKSNSFFSLIGGKRRRNNDK